MYYCAPRYYIHVKICKMLAFKERIKKSNISESLHISFSYL